MTIPTAVTVTARRGAALGLGAAITWVALGADSVLRPAPENYRDLLLLVPWVLTMATLAHVHLVQRAHGGRLESWSFRAVMASMTLALAGNIGVLVDNAALKTLGFPLGALLWVVAMVPFGIATVRAGVLPRHVGVALALLEPGSILTGVLLSPIAGLHDHGGYSGALEKGLIIFLVARALRRLAVARPLGDHARQAQPVAAH